MITESKITCSRCGFEATETMPADACQFFYECKGCATLLRPRAGDCCVFCSFGTVPCPPVQDRHDDPAAIGRTSKRDLGRAEE